MKNKFKILLLLSCLLLIGLVGLGNKVDAGGCTFVFNYGPYPGTSCSQVNQTLWNKLCDQSYPDCLRSYYWGNCWGSWYDVYCSPGDVTATCSACGNTINCPTTTPTDPPGEVKDCGESGCNSAPYPYCTSGNRCDGDVCNRISCPDGYRKSGYCDCVLDATPTPTFTPTPPPKTCGQSGCNIGGCTPSNISCNSSNVCQVTCPSGHELINNCNCLPPCSTLNVGFTQDRCSLNISISGASSYVRNLAFSGPPVSTITQNILYRHTITSAGTKAWRITWQEVASVGSATPRECFTDISNTIPVPSCGTVTTATNPAPPIWGENVDLRASISLPAGLTSTWLSNSHPTIPSTGCVGSPFPPTSKETCYVPYITGTPKIYPWTITWQTETVACPAVVNPSCICNATSTPPCSIEAQNRTGYLKTENGVSYIGNLTLIGNDNTKAINYQPKFSTLDKFSSNIFGSLNTGANNHTLSCSSNIVNCTLKRYLMIGYIDINSSSDWYSYLSNSLTTNPKLNILPTLTGTINYGSISGLVDNKVNLIKIDGSLNINEKTCVNSNVFLIRDNLIITSDFKVIDSNDACLFIVKGSTTIQKSPKAEQDCGGAEYPLQTVANPVYQDTIHAFIITGNFTTVKSARQLYIKGGVITNTFTGGLNRDVNSDTCRFPNMPSELMDYEGARYIKNLKDAIGESTTISIFENQYKSTE